MPDAWLRLTAVDSRGATHEAIVHRDSIAGVFAVENRDGKQIGSSLSLAGSSTPFYLRETFADVCALLGLEP